jgi:anion-transporting  ArsA/GET3 family ATPase
MFIAAKSYTVFATRRANSGYLSEQPMSLLSLVERRIIIVTGKGGVGKTTLTAALGRAFAAKGKRVLLAEIVPSPDTPSQLHDDVGGPEPTEEPALVSENLWLSLLTPTVGHLRFLQDALPIRILADAAMRSQALRKFLSAAPGFSDMGVMYRMLDLMKMKRSGGLPMFDICIIDSPATGHALALAQIPEFLTRVIPGGPILRAATEGVKVLTDPAVTGCVVVTLPETLPVTEALELEKGLAKHHLAVSAIVVNRVPQDPFSPEERVALKSMLEKGSGVFGTRELRRIERAESALKLLHEKHPEHSVVLAEVPGSGIEAATALSALL